MFKRWGYEATISHDRSLLGAYIKAYFGWIIFFGGRGWVFKKAIGIVARTLLAHQTA